MLAYQGLLLCVFILDKGMLVEDTLCPCGLQSRMDVFAHTNTTAFLHSAPLAEYIQAFWQDQASKIVEEGRWHRRTLCANLPEGNED